MGHTSPDQAASYHSLEELVGCLRVYELFDFLDLQASVFISSELCNPDCFAVQFHPS